MDEVLHEDKIRIDRIIVVEGRDDTDAVRKSVDAETIETHGYGISGETWQMLEKANDTKGLIIFTDPDMAGERIRKKLAERFPEAMHAFLDVEDATCEGDVGIENASPKTIAQALSKIHGNSAADETTQQSDEPEDDYTMKDMDLWGLNGAQGASERRRNLGKELGIGYSGAKTFLRRLNRFGIKREVIENALMIRREQ